MRKGRRANARELTASRVIDFKFPGWDLSNISIFKISCFGLILTLIAWIYVNITDPEVFPVRRVEIVGDFNKINKYAIKQAVLPYVIKGFFRVDLASIKHDVEEYPWVANCIIERNWPDEVVVKVIPHRVIASWNNQGLFSADHKLLHPNLAAMPQDLPRLYGPEDSSAEVLENYLAMQDILIQKNMHIKQFTLYTKHSNNQSMKIILTNGMQIMLGSNNPLQQLERFTDNYASILAKNETPIASVDLRYPHGIAVKRGELA